MHSRPVRIFSIVFNEPYMGWFERACVPSLMWPRNLAAVRQSVVSWDLWTTKEAAGRAAAAAARLGVPVNVDDSLEPSSWLDKEPLKRTMFRALLSELESCALAGHAFLWVAPDNVFGDGSLEGIFAMGAVPGVCVAFTPLRVNADGFLAAMGDGPLPNPELVRVGMEHAHAGFLHAEATREMTNSFRSGVSWRRIGARLYAVTARQHSSYLMQPTVPDVEWMRGFNKFGAYDHTFPSHLVDHQRQRVVGSSDAAFTVELTPADAGTTGLAENDFLDPDKFGQKLSHHKANRNALVIWRAA